MRAATLFAVVSCAILAGASFSARAQAVAHATGVIHTPAVDIGYETFGRPGGGLPVIAVNGGPGLSHAYMLMNDMWEKVAQGRFVIFYDQRGTGASKQMKAGASQDMDAQVADLDAVRAHFGLEKAVFVGDSYGGLIVMAYGAAHPEHVARMVLSDSAPPAWKDMVHLLPQTFPDIEKQDAEMEKKLAADPDAAARASLRNHFKMIFYSPEKRDAYMAKMGDLGYEPAVGEAVEKATADIDLTAALPKFRFPVLVITGRYDMNVAPLTAWRMAHAIPGAKIVFFEKSSHLPSYEEPEKYRAVLEGFLEGK
ncbi:MAG: alpha/beta fold hydrolase [Acidobacteriota bacterium]|nr:alpha/beta fold hydrolase [Acidobacteriota bacterium]